MRSLPRFLLGLLLASALGLTACASSSSTTSRGDSSEILGTWQYRAMAGSQLLDEGIFRITYERGRLRGILRDSRIGTNPVDVRYSGKQLLLDLDGIQIRGRVENNRFVAYYERSLWDVSSSQSFRHPSQRLNGSLSARRVEVQGYSGPNIQLGCDNLLIESPNRCE